MLHTFFLYNLVKIGAKTALAIFYKFWGNAINFRSRVTLTSLIVKDTLLSLNSCNVKLWIMDLEKSLVGKCQIYCFSISLNQR